MGIDFYACDNCGETFPDCGDYFRCDCGDKFCSTECGDSKVVEPASSDDEDDDSYREEVTTCMHCRLESATSYDLLLFILAKFNMTYDQAMDLYKAQKADNGS